MPAIQISLDNIGVHKKLTSILTSKVVASPSKAVNQAVKLSEIQKAEGTLETILSRDNLEEWTDEEAKAIALVYKNAMDSGDTETINKILKACLTGTVYIEKYDSKYCNAYSVSVDKSKVAAILSYLDPIDDMNNYNMLVRLEEFSKTDSFISEKDDYSFDDCLNSIEIDTVVEDGNVKKINISSRKRDVFTIESLDFSNAKVTDRTAIKLFGKDYVDELNVSFAFLGTQDDVDVLTSLYNRNYYETSKTNVDNLSYMGKLYFTYFANSLVNYGTKDDSLSELDYFLNELIRTDDGKDFYNNNFYAKEYLAFMADYSKLTFDEARENIFNELTSDIEIDELNDVSLQMKDNYALYALWTALSEAMSEDYFGYAYEQLVNNGTLKITDLTHDEGSTSYTLILGIEENNGTFMGRSYGQASGDENALLKKEVEIIAKVDSDVVNHQISDNAAAAKKTYNDRDMYGPLIGAVMDYYAADSDYEETISTVDADIIVTLMGSRVSIDINGTEQTIDKGVYDPRTMVSLYKLSEVGLVGVMDDNSNEIVNEIVSNSYYQDKENERYKTIFIENVYNTDPSLKGNEDEVAECIDIILYGNDDGIRLSDFDPQVLNVAIKLVNDKGDIECADYIYRERENER